MTDEHCLQLLGYRGGAVLGRERRTRPKTQASMTKCTSWYTRKELIEEINRDHLKTFFHHARVGQCREAQ